MPATLSIATLARKLKGDSSLWVHKAFREYRGFAWQVGYGGFTVGYREVPAVRAYIEGQREHHREVTFEDELRMLYEEHGIEYDEKYLL